MIDLGEAAVTGSSIEAAGFVVLFVALAFVARAVGGGVVEAVDCFMVGFLVVWGR
ncbi:MAG: hypothetical protein IPJ19_19835 [Planctomycetes bacterium]|nr:hypothetical protein [Planctomycetota bacterium]